MKVAKIHTVINANPKIVGEAHESWEGCGPLSSCREATFLDGTGLIFLRGINDDAVEFIESQLEADERVSSYSMSDE